MSIHTVDWNGFRADPENLPTHRPGCYLITNLIDDKKYVGVGGLSPGSNIYKRLRAHANGSSPKKLRNAILRHGLSSFLVQPIYHATVDDAIELQVVEGCLILDYDSIRWGYNVLHMSVGFYGPEFAAIQQAAHRTEDYRQKWREIRNNPIFKEKHREAIRNYQNKPEIRLKNSRNALSMWQDPVYVANRAAAFADPDVIARRLAVFNSDKLRAKKSEDSTAMWSDPVMKESISQSIREAWADPELRARQSSILKEAHTRPEVRLAKSAAMKLSNARPEVRAKNSASVSNLVWITDGKINQRIAKDVEFPHGWRSGRATVWITDGASNKMHSSGDPLPTGWRRGRTVTV